MAIVGCQTVNPPALVTKYYAPGYNGRRAPDRRTCQTFPNKFAIFAIQAVEIPIIGSNKDASLHDHRAGPKARLLFRLEIKASLRFVLPGQFTVLLPISANYAIL